MKLTVSFLFITFFVATCYCRSISDDGDDLTIVTRAKKPKPILTTYDDLERRVKEGKTLYVGGTTQKDPENRINDHFNKGWKYEPFYAPSNDVKTDESKLIEIAKEQSGNKNIRRGSNIGNVKGHVYVLIKPADGA